MLAIGLAGCGMGFPQGSGGPAANDCSPGEVKISNIGAIQIISGFVTVNCDAGTPKRYSADVELQWATGARSAERVWQAMGQGLTSTTIPSPDEEYHLSATCQPGRWRISFRVTGISSSGLVGGGTAFSHHIRITDCNRNYFSALSWEQIPK